jgi:uroporphyrin-III C-methyltransferase
VSEQGTKNNEQPGEASDNVVSAVEESTGKGILAVSGSKRGSVPRKASSAVAWLALLLVITLAGAAAWVIREGWDREAALTQRVADLETLSRQRQGDLDELSDQLQRQSRAGLGDLKAALDSETSRISQGLESVEAVLAEQQKELARFSASDRNSWLLAEAGHLLRLANQRLVMADDPVAAQALLNSADAVLRELDDVSLHTVRAAVAEDIASLRAAPRVDVEGIYLRLAALIGQADTLVIFHLPEQAAQPAPESAKNWQGRLQQGYAAALAKLSDYLIIRRRDVPMQALMDPQWEGLVRQNLRMLLEQAQMAALSNNQTLYAASLELAQQWVAQFQDSDEVTARAMAAELVQLADLTVYVPQPDISRSLQALDEATRLRLQTRGNQ